MSTYDDIDTIENSEHRDLEYFRAMQRSINAGMWTLQGSFGRAMMNAIENGACMLGRVRAHDYWGNMIPARTDVKRGTKGSRAFVAARMGEKWARAMARL